jgi:hypothetical protein
VVFSQPICLKNVDLASSKPHQAPTSGAIDDRGPGGLQRQIEEFRMSLSRTLGLAALCAAALPAAAQSPDPLAVAGGTLVSTVHAEGAQVYECAPDASGKLAWRFREPVATLLVDGKTVGRHYAGPNWEMADGSSVTAKVAGRSLGASANDIPLLKLIVTERRGPGQLSAISAIQRLNTKGGVAEGACPSAGAFLSVPYSADYAFFRTGG